MANDEPSRVVEKMSENFAAEIKAINDLRAKYEKKHTNDKVKDGNGDKNENKNGADKPSVIGQDYQRPYIVSDALSEVSSFPDIDQRDHDLFDETAMNSNQLNNVEEKTNSQGGTHSDDEYNDYNHDHHDDRDDHFYDCERHDNPNDHIRDFDRNGNECGNGGDSDSECERESEDEDEAKQEILETDSSIAINEINRNLRKGVERAQQEQQQEQKAPQEVQQLQSQLQSHGSAHVRSQWQRVNRRNIGNNSNDGSSRQSGSSYESRSSRSGRGNSRSDGSVRQRENRNEKEKEKENRGCIDIDIDYDCGNVVLSNQSQSIDSNDNDHCSEYSKYSKHSKNSKNSKNSVATQSVYSNSNSNDNYSNDYNNNNDNDDINNNHDNDLQMMMNIHMDKCALQDIDPFSYQGLSYTGIITSRKLKNLFKRGLNRAQIESNQERMQEIANSRPNDTRIKNQTDLLRMFFDAELEKLKDDK